MAEAQEDSLDWGIWRQDDILVMHHDATLPPRCLRTNLPANKYLSQQFSWCSPLTALLLVFLFFCTCVGMVLALMLSYFVIRRVTLRLPFSEPILAQRRKKILAGLTGCAASCAFFPAASLSNIPLLALFGIICMLASFVWLSYCNMLVTVKSISPKLILLKGVCPEFLDELPELGGPRD